MVANHPNSFLDAIIIAAHFGEPVYFLARGDAFHKPWHRYLLGLLHMVPIYRLSEGKENLHLNEYAFKKAQQLLRSEKIVLIFIEGICLNTHTLQPFKKGAARIAITASHEKIPLRIMPVTVTYNSFIQTGKSVRIALGEPIAADTLLPHTQESKSIRHFNSILFDQLNGMIQKPLQPTTQKTRMAILLSAIGYFLHQPLYLLIKRYVQQKTRRTVFYDSVLFGVLLLTYPFYLLLITALLLFVHVPVYLILLILLIHPITAGYAVRYKIKPPTSS